MSAQDFKEYEKLLRLIALKQYDLLCLMWDSETHQPVPRPQKRLFGKNRRFQLYSQYLNELEELKEKAGFYKDRSGLKGTYFWWKTSWDKTEENLLYDMSFMPDEDGWRFQRCWDLEKIDGENVLFLIEEGNCSNYSSSIDFRYGIKSRYSLDEINERINRFEKDVKKYERETSWQYDKLVEVDGKLYSSGSDYILSNEHSINVSNQRDELHRNLYTNTETTQYSIISHSVNYKALFIVGGYMINPYGVIYPCGAYGYGLVSQKGNVPDEIIKRYKTKDSAVGLACYFANNPNFSYLNPNIWGRSFGGDFLGSVSDLNTASRLSEIYTCLSQKIQ